MSDDAWSRPLTVAEMYGDWDYEAAVVALERSLGPRSGDSIYDTVAALGPGTDQVILDVGGRDARRGLEMAARFGCRVISVDPADENIRDAHQLIAEHPSGALVEARFGEFEQLPVDDASCDVVFSRDVIGHVVDIDRALAECDRVLIAGGAMVIHDVFETESIEPREAARLYADIAVVPERMSSSGFEAAIERAGFVVDDLDIVGSEWHEANQEAGVVPNYLLQVSRLRRAKADLVTELGEAAYRSMYGNALWSIYQLIGKLESRVYTLRRAVG